MKFLVLVVVLYFFSYWVVHKITEVKKPSTTQSQIIKPQKIKTKTVSSTKKTKALLVDSGYTNIPVKRTTTKTLSPGKPKIVIIMDDMGNTRENISLLKTLGNQITYAILPLVPHSKYFSQLSHETGAEVILHLPLETQNGTVPGPGLITSRMAKDHILGLLTRDFESVPDLVGANNHMGSLGTENFELMEIILTEFKKRNWFFVDSHTTPQSVIGSVGAQLGMPILHRDVFLDNIDQQTAIKIQLKKLKIAAQNYGYAIGICHYRFNTLKVLNEEIPKTLQEGYEIVSLRDLIQYLKL